jgi:DinB superfamily
MITPDEKDWTWVLNRPCPECGFDASRCALSDVPEFLRANAAEWQSLLDQGVIRAGRPFDTSWSTLEYACHVRDVFERYALRIELMLCEDDPLYPNWDQDASAIADRYEDQDPATVVAALATQAEALAGLIAGLSVDDGERAGRRSDGAAFTIDSLCRYMIHDPIHHIWDVTGSDRT